MKLSGLSWREPSSHTPNDPADAQTVAVGQGERRKLEVLRQRRLPRGLFRRGGDVIFTTDDLRVRVGLKEREDPIPLCYCFGFDEADVREEIARTGGSAIPQRVAAMVEQGLCACETRNPSVACCLGEVTRTVTRLTCGDLLNDQAGDSARRAALPKRSEKRSSEIES